MMFGLTASEILEAHGYSTDSIIDRKEIAEQLVAA